MSVIQFPLWEWDYDAVVALLDGLEADDPEVFAACDARAAAVTGRSLRDLPAGLLRAVVDAMIRDLVAARSSAPEFVAGRQELTL